MRRFTRFPLYIVLILWSIICLYPLVWMISTSLKTMPEVTEDPAALIPETPHWANYLETWTKGNFGTYFKNSLIITGAVLLLVLWTTSMTAFAITRTDFPGKRLILYALVVTLFIPAEATLVPVFHIAKSCGGALCILTKIFCWWNSGNRVERIEC